MPTAVPAGSLIDRLHVRLFEASCREINHLWNAPHVRSSYWRFYVNNRDGAHVSLDNGAIYRLTPGRVHLIPAWVQFSCHNTARIEHLYAHFDVVGLTNVAVRRLFTRPYTLPTDAGLLAMAGELGGRLAQRPATLEDRFFAKGLIHLGLSQLMAQLSDDQVRQCERLIDGQDPLIPAIQHIDAHLADPLPNAELARLCHLSEDHFIRRFKQSVGQTPAQYVIERRVATAAQRLAFTNDAIEQVAEDAGFANRYYFTRIFKRLMSVPPATYRRASRP